MPVISFVSSKGGVGKSTAVLVLAAEFARAGASRVGDPGRGSKSADCRLGEASEQAGSSCCCGWGDRGDGDRRHRC